MNDSKILEYVKPEERCYICRIRKATVQCDYQTPAKYFMRTYELCKEMNKGPHTCFRIMCDKCSKKIGDKDYCQEHYIKIKGGKINESNRKNKNI